MGSIQPPFSSSRVGFLEKADERFMLAVPFVGFVWMVAYWGMGRVFGTTSSNLQLTRLIVALIFLDSIHVIYTLILLRALPEMREWASRWGSEGARRRPKFWTTAGWISAFLFVGFYFLAVSDQTKDIPWVLAAFLLIEVIAPAQHIVAQMRGISFCYNAAIRSQRDFSPEERPQAAVCETRERVLTGILLFSHLAYWIPRTLKTTQFGLPGSALIKSMGLTGMIAVSFLILLNATAFPRQGQSHKLLFLARVFIYPLKALTLSAAVVSRAVHGTEYLVIFRKMVKSSSLSEDRKKATFGAAWIASLIYGATVVAVTPPLLRLVTHAQAPKLIFGAFMLFHLVTRYLHYYLDRVIYRMSDPSTRRQVGPLLRAHGEEGRAQVSPAAA